MATKDISSRGIYLHKIGLKSDPFITPVAEQEISASDDISTFFSYYSQLEACADCENSISWLRQEKHNFVYGVPGSGKTTKRLRLEVDCRTELDGTLVVTYLLGEDVRKPLTAEEHAERLAQAIAIDLTIQVFEQITPKAVPFTEKQLNLLRAQIQQGGPYLKRMVRTLAESVFAQDQSSDLLAKNSRAGLSIYWRRVGRYPVRYVVSSQPLEQLLKVLMEPTAVQLPSLHGFDALWQSVEAARAWNYQRLFVLVDGVDTRERTPDKMLTLILPLLEHLPQFQDQKLYFKFFLPLEIKSKVDKYIRRVPGLKSAAMDATITWNQQALRQLLIQRFRAAGSQSINSLDILAGEDLNQELERSVLELAKGSPRRMLAIVSELINAHISRRADQIKFDRGDWDLMEQLTRWLPADPDHP